MKIHIRKFTPFTQNAKLSARLKQVICSALVAALLFPDIARAMESADNDLPKIHVLKTPAVAPAVLTQDESHVSSPHLSSSRTDDNVSNDNNPSPDTLQSMPDAMADWDTAFTHTRDLLDGMYNVRTNENLVRIPTLRQEMVTWFEEFGRLDELKQLFKYASDEEIHDLYERVLVDGFKVTKNGNQFPKDDETLKTADVLRTLRVLGNIYQENLSWKKIISTILGWGISGTANAGRALIFYAIIHQVQESLGLPYHALNDILWGCLGIDMTSTLQGNAVKAGIHKLLFREATDEDASQNHIWKILRKFGKGYSFAQGAQSTLFYILLGVAATSGWPLAIQIATLLFFAGADIFNNATSSFYESYEDVVSSDESSVSYEHKTAGDKRNQLIRLVSLYKKAYKAKRAKRYDRPIVT